MMFNIVIHLTKARFIRRISVASNAIKTIDNEEDYLIIHLFELHSTRRKFDVYKTCLSLNSVFFILLTTVNNVGTICKARISF